MFKKKIAQFCNDNGYTKKFISNLDFVLKESEKSRERSNQNKIEATFKDNYITFWNFKSNSLGDSKRKVYHELLHGIYQNYFTTKDKSFCKDIIDSLYINAKGNRYLYEIYKSRIGLKSSDKRSLNSKMWDKI